MLSPWLRAVAAIALPALAAAAEGPALRAHPSEIVLEHGRDFQRLVLVIERADGVTNDVTRTAEIRFDQDGLAAWDGEVLGLRPEADGETRLVASAEGLETAVPVTVRNSGTIPPISYANDVQPVLMRAGCNAGSCHGAASGKNGFKMSLFGFDPNDDHMRFTRETWGRRLNMAVPEESLLLRKATGEAPHEGGTRFTRESPYYAILRDWIAQGAVNDTAQAPALEGVRILPEEAVLEAPGGTQRYTVLADYADGTVRDVTDLAVLNTSDALTLPLDAEAGEAEAGQRGEAYVMARFGSFAVVSQAIVIPKDEPMEWPDIEPVNYIDEHVFAKLKKLRTPPAARADDSTFIRRLYLDTLGVLPTVDETRAFLADEAPDKRARLIDELLERPEFVDVWSMKWAESLQVRSSQTLDKKAMYRYNDWIRASIADNKPIDELVQELLGAEGGNFTSPAANFYLVEDQPEQIAENVAQVFLGIQLQCAQCHNHPFERWTMDDYYSFSAFFAQVGRKNSSDPRERIIFNAGGGEVNHLNTGQPMAPKFLGGAVPDVEGKDRRAVLAEWLTSKENPWFAQNIANRVWEQFLGRGIIDPVDDVRVTNPPANPALLEAIGQRIADVDYDLRTLVRDIANSHTYQMGTQPAIEGVRDERNFAVASVRRLPAETLLDAISQVTETHVKFAALPLGASAAQVADGNTGNYFLDVFGRPARESACTCERRGDPTLAQALHLINGATVDNAVTSEQSRIADAVAAEKPAPDIVAEAYLAAFARDPLPEEMEQLTAYIDGAENRRQAVEDVYWSILNAKEFVFNH